MKHMVQERGLDLVLESRGTGGGSGDWYKPGGFSYHVGDPPDSRSKKAASKRGYHLTSRSQPLSPEDLEHFDLILAMDRQNVADILEAAAFWGPKALDNAKRKTKLLCSFCIAHKATEVPDPYYGGAAGFERVLDLIEDACRGVLSSLQL
jgi:protein-tyrosine phosphatase